MSVETIHLYYREGTSDKVYSASIDPSDGGYLVNFSYGKRGSNLSTGSKTKSPVPLEEARKVYEKIVKEKMAKGYQPGEAGHDFVPAVRDMSDIDPCQQPVDLEERELSHFLADPNYWMQEKKDGVRLRLRIEGDAVSARNKKGERRLWPSEMESAIKALGVDVEFDGELIGTRLYAFDLLMLKGQDLKPLSFEDRFERLESLAPQLEGSAIEIVPVAETEGEKRELLEGIRSRGGEGVVLKARSAHYVPGKPASGAPQRKFKLYKTASVLVVQANGQRSVGMAVLSGESRTPIGNVTIPPNAAIPPIGSVIEVRYLYANRGTHALQQPVYLGEREDVDVSECTIDQLQYRSDAT